MFQLTWFCASLGTGPSGWREVGDTRNIPQPRSSKFSWRSMIDTQVLGQSNWYIRYILLLQTILISQPDALSSFGYPWHITWITPVIHPIQNCRVPTFAFNGFRPANRPKGTKIRRIIILLQKMAINLRCFPWKKKLLGKVNTVKWKENKWSSNMFK